MQTRLSDLIEEFVIARRTEGLSPKTLSWYAWLLGKFAEFLGDPRLNQVTLENARRFIALLQDRQVRYENHPKAPEKPGGLSTYTIASYVRALKVFGAWLAEDAEYLSTNPFAKLKRPKVAEPLIEVLSDDEIGALVQAINPNTFIGARIYAILLLLLDTDIRASELCTLTMEHTDLEHGAIKVMGKGKKERAVPFCAATKRALSRYVSTFRPATTCPNLFVNEDGGPLTYNALKLILLRLGRKANVPRLHPHLLRHTFAVKYLMNGGDVMTLRLMLGHTTLQVTQLYLHLTEAHVQTQHAKFSPVERLGIGTGRRNGSGKQVERH